MARSTRSGAFAVATQEDWARIGVSCPDFVGQVLQKGEENGYDLILYALFSRPFRPIGFLDFHAAEARKLLRSLQDGVDKTCFVSFGSPYFADQYAERALTCVNAYSMLAPSVRAFVRAATGEIPFSTFSPVRLHQDMEPMPWW